MVGAWKKKKFWYLDNGCLRNMLGYASKFTDLEYEKGRLVTFNNNNKEVVIVNNGIEIENVFLVKGHKYNLLNINYLCNENYHVEFVKYMCRSAA